MPFPKIHVARTCEACKFHKLSLFTLAVGIFVYFWGLGSPHIPNIGDEVLYQQIARVTAESGHWLPLRYSGGILSTKPPLLYWIGMITTHMAHDYTLLNLRWPCVVVTLLTAFLVGWIAYLRRKNFDTAATAAAIFLGFHSTFQQGRPFLVHPFEMFFLLLPLAVLVARPQSKRLWWILCALSWAGAAWAKSFALIAVGFLSLWAALRFKKTFFLISAAAVALGIFSLWFYFDPDPQLLFQQFVIGENVVKFKDHANYFSGLFSGDYPIYRIWLGAFANAGLYAIMLVGLLGLLWKKRRSLEENDKSLLAFAAAFLVFYSLPTQRQENYILPTMGVWAVLLAERLAEIPKLFAEVSMRILSLGLLGQKSRKLFPLLVFCAYFLLSTVIDVMTGKNFEYFKDPSLTDRKVYVPIHMVAQEERFRFIAPGAEPIPYESDRLFVGNPDSLTRNSKCESFALRTLLIIEDPEKNHCSRPLKVIETIRDFKTRQSLREMLLIAMGHKEYLLRDLILVELQ